MLLGTAIAQHNVFWLQQSNSIQQPVLQALIFGKLSQHLIDCFVWHVQVAPTLRVVIYIQSKSFFTVISRAHPLTASPAPPLRHEQ